MLYTCICMNRRRFCKCYSCFTLMIKIDLQDGFFKIFFIKRIWLKLCYWYITMLQSCTTSKQRNTVIIKCLVINFFCNSQFKIYNCNSAYSYNRKTWVDIPSYIIFFMRMDSSFFFDSAEQGDIPRVELDSWSLNYT